ncbi:TPA: hypothetical protein MYO83_005575 [Klebsiella michiganensis]|nr:hypothetical protein [Klebsiella michiganensis]HCB1849081.1 hypothetical protein [Klebsiella oxytoca]
MRAKAATEDYVAHRMSITVCLEECKEFNDLSDGPDNIIALVEALEKAQQRNGELETYSKTALEFREAARDENRHLKLELEIAEKRIAELEESNTQAIQSRDHYKRMTEEGLKRLAESRTVTAAAADLLAERQRQISAEGWAPEHDDEHCNGELAMAAVCYINETGTVNRNGGKPWGWPWAALWWKPDTRRRNMVKAGALILAEIERLDRAAGIKWEAE